MKLLENIVSSSSKIIKNGWKDKLTKEGYVIFALVGIATGVLYLNKQYFIAEYTGKLMGISLFVNLCHHAFIGINNSYQKL